MSENYLECVHDVPLSQLMLLELQRRRLFSRSIRIQRWSNDPANWVKKDVKILRDIFALSTRFLRQDFAISSLLSVTRIPTHVAEVLVRI